MANFISFPGILETDATVCQRLGRLQVWVEETSWNLFDNKGSYCSSIMKYFINRSVP